MVIITANSWGSKYRGRSSVQADSGGTEAVARESRDMKRNRTVNRSMEVKSYPRGRETDQEVRF